MRTVNTLREHVCKYKQTPRSPPAHDAIRAVVFLLVLYHVFICSGLRSLIYRNHMD